MIPAKIKRLLSSDLVRVSSLNAVSTVIRMITGLVSVKVVAAILKPEGIALLGQLTNFTAIIQSISNGGINAGTTKYVSEYAGYPGRYRLFIGTSLRITIFFSILCSLALFLFAGYFAELILHDRQYKYVFYVFGGTLILYSLNALLISVLNGFKEYRLYVIANILGSIVGLLFSVVLALTYGIPGALISAVTFQSVVFFLTLWMVRNSSWFNWKSFFASFSKLALRRLGGFSLMALASAITIPAGQLLVRNFIIEHQSIDEAGLWEGINRISNMYLTIITVSLAVYYLPRMSELKERNAIRQEVFSVYKLMLPFLLITTTLIFLFRGLIIRILFTEEFAPMEKLFAWQLVGDFLKIAGWVLGYLLIAKAMSKTYVILELFNFVLLVSICYFLVPYAGSVGATQAYAILYAVYLFILLFVFRNLLFGSKKLNSKNDMA